MTSSAATNSCHGQRPFTAAVYAKTPEEKSRFTFLTERLPRDNNFARRRSSYSPARQHGNTVSDMCLTAVLEAMDMQRLGIYFFSLALALGGYVAPAAGDSKAAELIKQARAALGGDAKLTKVQSL